MIGSVQSCIAVIADDGNVRPLVEQDPESASMPVIGPYDQRGHATWHALLLIDVDQAVREKGSHALGGASLCSTAKVLHYCCRGRSSGLLSPRSIYL